MTEPSAQIAADNSLHPGDRRPGDWADKWLQIGLCLFVSAFFVLGSGKPLNNIFYAAVLPPALVILYRHRAQWSVNYLFGLLGLLLFYLACSTWWGEQDNFSKWFQSTKHCIYVLAFVYGMSLLYQNQAVFWLIVRVILIAACVGLAVNVWVWWTELGGAGRLSGKVVAENPVDLGVAYGFASLLGIGSFMFDARQRWLSALVTCLLLGGLFLTSTRVAIAALGVAALIVIVFAAKNKKAVLFGVLFIGAVGVGAWSLGYLDRFQNAFSERGGMGARLLIWQTILEIVQSESLIWGIGMHTPVKFPVEELRYEFSTSHNQYVGSFLFGGIVGLLLMLIALAAAFFIAVKRLIQSRNPFPFALLTYGALVSLAHGTRILGHPGDNWMYWWFPFAVVLSTSLFTPTGAGQKTSPG